MSKVDTCALAAALSLYQVEADQLSLTYDETIYALGALPFLVELNLLDVTSEQALFTFPEHALQMLACWYDTRILDYISQAQLESVSSYWQNVKGTPVAYVDENISLEVFKLYPLPDLASEPPTSIGSPLGQNYPRGHVAVLSTVFVQDVPLWLELPIALLILAREYARETPHMDLDFSKGCQTLGNVLMNMLTLSGVE